MNIRRAPPSNGNLGLLQGRGVIVKLRPTFILAPLLVAACASTRPLLTSAERHQVFVEPEAVKDWSSLRSTTKAQLLTEHPVISEQPLGFDPASAARLDLIQQRRYQMDAEELALFKRAGFVVSEHRFDKSFAMAYLELFKYDLPVYVTADAILHAWHRAYDELRIDTEKALLGPLLQDFLNRLRQRLANVRASATTRADLDEYLAVALGLLTDRGSAAVAGGKPAIINEAFVRAREPSGAGVTVFGSPRTTDMTQFTPRGHYERHPELIPYFRSMMWLGRIDFRFFESQPDGHQVFNRRAIDAAVLLRDLMDEQTRAEYRAIDEIVSVFVGMGDSMSPPDIERLLSDLHVRSLSDLARLDDATVAGALRQGHYGRQRIMSDVMVTEGSRQLPLNGSFTIFGQRYLIDSHVLHQVTFDRVPRDMPDSFDVAFAVFGNNLALQLLAQKEPELLQAGALAQMRRLTQAQTDRYWHSSLYPAWLDALSTLSPQPAEQSGLPRVARTEAWQRRILATQLASWSEARHDTILYAKQSYTAHVICKFPDAYVNPYPRFFRRLKEANQLGAMVIDDVRSVVDQVAKTNYLDQAQRHFERAAEIMQRLERMAERELDGKSLRDSDLDFMNTMIKANYQRDSFGCGGGTVTYDGWYKDLLYTADLFDPELTIADVHTAQSGILHVAKGWPLRFVVAVDSPAGPRAFIGATYSFNQLVAGTRLTDSRWSMRFTGTPTESWLLPITAHPRGDYTQPAAPTDLSAPPQQPEDDIPSVEDVISQ